MTTFICATRDVAERHRLQAELELLHDIVQTVESAPSLDDALRVALWQLCEATGWSYGEAWFPADDESSLVRSHVWYQRATTTAEALAAASAGLALLPGEEAAGHAWAASKVIWVRDASTSSLAGRRREATRAAGFNVNVAIPVVSGGRSVAVLLFMMPTADADDAARIAFVSVVCAQLGATIARSRAEQERASERQFLMALLDGMSEARLRAASDGGPDSSMVVEADRDDDAPASCDISQRQELDRMKDEFLSVVSHELRTPLASIRGSLGLLASGRLAAAPGKAERMLDLAVSNTDRLVQLVNDILDIERIDSGTIAIERAWCDGAELARRVVESLRPVAEQAGVELATSGDDDVRLFADADRVTQTLVNLVGNAIKFSPGGTRVDVTASAHRGTALFEVRDRGRGIPADKLETIFDRFEQVDASDAREKGGAGLGLAICRGIVRQHGGRIWAELPEGGGCIFRFTLPLPSTPQSVVA